MVSIADIEQERAAILKRVVSTILRNDISRDVFAQIIDGLPIKTTYELTVTRRFDLLSRPEASQPAKMEAQTFCDSIEMLNDLNLDSKTAQLFQQSPIFSSSFNMHLLELSAIAIHEMAGNLFATFHPDGEPRSVDSRQQRFQPNNTISLSTMSYAISDRYPRGHLDAVGYWAETNIFGGAVVFDRGSEEGARHCNGAYLHPRYPAPLFQLSEHQLATFSLAGSEQSHRELSLPFVCEPDAKQVDHYTAFKDLDIYRDRYERRVDSFRRHGPCVVRLEDHPELQEFGKMAREMFGSRQNAER